MSYLLGYDLGSSSVKASLIEADTGKLIAAASAPATEMDIASPKPGWAEQDPELWWTHTVAATRQLLQRAGPASSEIKAIGISYQMHGLVVVDKHQQVLRPAIIWCDSRAVDTGNQAYHALGESYCQNNLLNSPGNFTASKLKWVKDHEPDVYARIDKYMLPGDYLAMRLTGEIATTIPGLSEGIIWDYQKQDLATELLQVYGIDSNLIPTLVNTFVNQGSVTRLAAEATGLQAGTPVTYRAGDQPNNAFSLNVLSPGELATTAGTSGVIYGVVDQPTADPQARVNTFVHVNHTSQHARLGVMLCVNGTGILNRWLRNAIVHAGKTPGYAEMNVLASQVAIGSDGLTILPFGNGAERVLQNRQIGSSLHGLDFNRHTVAHLCRAAQEGIVFSLGYGFEILNQLGIQSAVIRAGHANMFLSDVFSDIFTQITNTELQLYNTDGAEGAARGAGVGVGHYKTPGEAFSNLACMKRYQPDASRRAAYQEPYHRWKEILHSQLIK